MQSRQASVTIVSGRMNSEGKMKYSKVAVQKNGEGLHFEALKKNGDKVITNVKANSKDLKTFKVQGDRHKYNLQDIFQMIVSANSQKKVESSSAKSKPKAKATASKKGKKQHGG